MQNEYEVNAENTRIVKEKFSRLISRCGMNNIKGTKRYEWEIKFCYLSREIDDCPDYLVGKNIENLVELCNELSLTFKDTV